MYSAPLFTLAVCVGLLGASPAPAQERGAVARERFLRAYYLEREEGQRSQALELYRAAAQDPDLPAELRERAEERGSALYEDLAADDLAALVPLETLAYVELEDPAARIEMLLDQLGLLRGSVGAEDLAISPLLLDALLGVRGVALAVTGFDPRVESEPRGVAILHPGDMDLIRGLVETALPLGGEPEAAIGGFDTYGIDGQLHVTLTRRLVIVSRQREEIEGVVTRLENGGSDSLARNPRMARTLAMRGEDLLFFCLNPQPVMPVIEAAMEEELRRDPELAILSSLFDIESTQAIGGRIGIDEEGLSFDLGLELAEGHQNVVFNLLRMPELGEESLALVPEGVAFFVAGGVNASGSMPGGIRGTDGEAVVTLMDFGREVFANVRDVAVWSLPSTSVVGGRPLPDLALSFTSADPERSKALWSLALGIAQASRMGAREGHSLEAPHMSAEGGGIRAFDLGEFSLYLATSGDRVVLTPSRRALEAAIAAGRGSHVGRDEAYRSMIGGLGEGTTLAVGVSPRRCAALAAPFLAPGDGAELETYADILGDSVLWAALTHTDSSAHLRLRLAHLPRVGPLVGAWVRQRRGLGMPPAPHSRAAIVSQPLLVR